METIRLDKYLSITCKMTKQEIQECLKQGKVQIDNEIIYDKKKIISLQQKVKVNNREITRPVFIYYMLNKPKGVVSALKDLNETTILDLMDVPYKEELRIMGRLDKDTTGLVILTNDLRLIKHHTLPQYQVQKIYEVVLKEPITSKMIEQFKKGVVIDQNVVCKEATLIKLNEYTAQVILTEGKYHQIKKMFLSVGNQVVELKRIAMNQLKLDDRLSLGKYRELNGQEITLLKKA